MDVLKPHYREVADELGIRQALFYFSKEAIKGEFSYDMAKKHALDLVKEHYAIIDNKEKFTSKSFEDVPLSKQIFVVHGHDIEMRETVARTLEKLGLIPVILDEQANKGLTVIEKFIKNSNVTFAVVLLSPDDRGAEKIKRYNEQKLRARQNAIFELGFFIGKLRREQVFVLYRPDNNFEFPSDYYGEAYSIYDNPTGQWRLDLIQELQENGYPVDANKLTRQCDEGN
jgi:predicted nucleotide-binding protein